MTMFVFGIIVMAIGYYLVWDSGQAILEIENEHKLLERKIELQLGIKLKGGE